MKRKVLLLGMFSILALASAFSLPVVVTLAPNFTTVYSGTGVQFTATVLNTTNTAVTWFTCGGTITSTGMWTAPTVTKTASFCVTAISVADPSKSATSFAQVLPPAVCDPPNYTCASSETDVVQPGPAPFNASSPVNTVVQETVLSKGKISLLTGDTTGGGLCGANNQWNATPSGGSSDVITNTNDTLLIIACNGGGKYFVGFNPKTLQMFPAPPAKFASGTKCNGSVAFSRVNPLVAYCRLDTFLYKITFSTTTSGLCGLSSCPDPTVPPAWSLMIDLSTCPRAEDATPTWASLLGVGINDSILTQALSWAGGQGTGHYQFTYVPGAPECQSTFDTQGNAVNPVWYAGTTGIPTAITNVSATWFIHDVTTTGSWTELAMANCAGPSCGTVDGPPSWQVNTTNLIMFSTLKKSSGHHDYTLSYFVNNNSPQVYKHPLSAPTTYTQIANFGCAPSCTDFHMNGDITNDVNPVLGTTSVPNAVWSSAYRNEVVGVTMDGSLKVFRFSPTWSSGTNVTGFWAQFGIGAPSQTRCEYFFTSDMLGALGKTSTGLNKWEIFAVGLCGQ